jgi:hypothetical protein
MLFRVEPQHLHPEFTLRMCSDVLDEGMPVNIWVQIAIVRFRLFVLPLIHIGHYGNTATRKR